MADIIVVEASIAAAANATTDRGTAGDTITQGQPVYLDATTSTYKRADADDTAVTADCVGIALNSVLSGQPIDFIKAGTLTVGAGGTPPVVGRVYVVSGTVGRIADVADLASNDWTTVVAIGLTSTTIKVGINVSGVQVP